ncbi:MAG: hypothetical protein A4S12_04185 [Proteobacteria bacterium SG_bin5]|nr:hypothetical protein [Sphingomonas sp.]OQW43581.1 MAG: hypothetical protein A4S12_04185 [Proteobacteria bacterium SG_bin5]
MTATPDISARRIGQEREPLVIVDGFAPDPDALRAAAAAARFAPAGEHYPGVRAPLPADYLASVRPVLATVLREVFGARARLRVLDARFSLVTTPPDRLTLEQRLPHVDALEPGRIALVHYLMPGGGDGTAFFRHRATGYETLDATRAPRYQAMLAAELRAAAPAGYIAGDTALFERIAVVPAEDNRAVIYRSALFHSGAISPGARLSADPRLGRLTVTAFLAAE